MSFGFGFNFGATKLKPKPLPFRMNKTAKSRRKLPEIRRKRKEIMEKRYSTIELYLLNNYENNFQFLCCAVCILKSNLNEHSISVT